MLRARYRSGRSRRPRAVPVRSLRHQQGGREGAWPGTRRQDRERARRHRHLRVTDATHHIPRAPAHVSAGPGVAVMSTRTVLVAADDAAIRTVLNQALARAGYNVLSTGNAATLWKWIQAGEGDVVVTDVIMPDENAFNLLPRVRKVRPELPVVVMSAQNTIMTAINA